MKTLPLLIALIPAVFLTGCQTVLKGNNGQTLAIIPADAENFEYVNSIQGITLRASSLNHSRPTAAALHGAARFVSAAGLAAAPFLAPVSAAQPFVSALPTVGAAASLFQGSPASVPAASVPVAPFTPAPQHAPAP